MKKKGKRPNGSRNGKKLAKTRRVLCFLADLTNDYFDIWYDARDFRGALMTGGPEFVRAIKKDLEWKKYRTTLYQLRRSEYIELEKSGDSLRLRLTENGWLTSLSDRIKAAERLPDGDICLVSFDIPETHRRMRLQLRRLLKRWGFRMRHESLWSSDRDASSQIVQVIGQLKGREWVHVYHCRRILD